jgi:prevent-host-death family protein
MQISLTEAKGKLTDLVRRAEAGDEVILTRHGRAVVRLVPVRFVPDRKARRKLLEAIRMSGRAEAASGPGTARSQDFLYSEDGLPELSPSMHRRSWPSFPAKRKPMDASECWRQRRDSGFSRNNGAGADRRRTTERCRPYGQLINELCVNVVAVTRAFPLLFVGDDFSKTDLEGIL